MYHFVSVFSSTRMSDHRALWEEEEEEAGSWRRLHHPQPTAAKNLNPGLFFVCEEESNYKIYKLLLNVAQTHSPLFRYVLSSQRGYQNAALSRLDQIESRLRSHKQAQEHNRQEPKLSESLNSDWNISSLPAAKSLEASVQLSAQSGSEQSLPGKRFLKKTTAANDAAAASSSRDRDSGFRSVSRAAGAAFPLASWDQKPGRVVSGVSLESDEEDMKKLLGDSLDSIDGSFGKPGRPSSARTTDKVRISFESQDNPLHAFHSLYGVLQI